MPPPSYAALLEASRWGAELRGAAAARGRCRAAGPGCRPRGGLCRQELTALAKPGFNPSLGSRREEKLMALRRSGWHSSPTRPQKNPVWVAACHPRRLWRETGKAACAPTLHISCHRGWWRSSKMLLCGFFLRWERSRCILKNRPKKSSV